MTETVYILCAATSVGCALLLLRGYLRDRTKFLFWSSFCFAGLALNNVLLFVDLVMVPLIDLGLIRGVIALLSVMTLLVGFIWESQ